MNNIIKKQFDAIDNQEAICMFFDWLNDFFTNLGLNGDSEKIALVLRKDKVQINCDLNNRVVLSINREKDLFLRIMLSNQDIEAFRKLINFEKEHNFDNSDDSLITVKYDDNLLPHLEAIKTKWLLCCKKFEPLQQSSKDRNKHEPDLYELVKNREELKTYFILIKTNNMEFFNENDFELINLNNGKNLGKNDQEYQDLGLTYSKVEFWAENVCKSLGEEFRYKIVKKPTNQSGKVEHYQWAKLYPNKEFEDKKYLAFTISINAEDQLTVKIDTIGLDGKDTRRKIYENFRGDFSDSKYVNFFYKEDVLKMDWEHLTQITSAEISKLIPAYNTLYSLLENSSSQDIMPQMEVIKNHPLNQILYGPPGTGKTYNTINRALAILEPNHGISDRTEQKRKFDEYVRKGQIVFTTFHQSMSYEDFIEGIKPETDNEGKVTYFVKNGIFKDLCLKANTPNQATFDNAYQRLVDFFNDKDKDFKFELKTTTGKVFAIGLNSNDNLSLFTGRNLNKQGTLTKRNIQKQIKGEDKFIGWEGYFNSVLNHLIEEYNYSAIENITLPYILIIDEINRGNVSAIFGELITLIEESKRLGKAEALTVTLPYSKESFGVPPNLYIIGTMNTADRSVEALDTALRRRFVFEEMMPNYELLADKNIDNISLKTILETINNRIEVLLSRDHLIGHSYFLEVDSWEKLNETFYKNIIPLLQEYFYGDYGKIGLVLGSGFVEKTESKSDIFGDFSNDYEGYTDKIMYRIKSNSQGFNIQNAITELLKNGKK